MNDQTEVYPGKLELISRIEAGWAALWAWLDSLSDEQRTRPTDAAGWTIKDHIMHLAVWEDGMDALLRREDRAARMGLTRPQWESRDHDTMNAVIFAAHRDRTWDAVRAAYAAVHERFMAALAVLPEADLMQPYRLFTGSASDDDEPVITRLMGNTYEHYDEHLPWMQRIVGQA